MSGEAMNFPDTAEEFMEQYKIVDSEEVYTNGAELVPIFRMEQWFKQHPEPRWIPCSERLPEKNEEVLLTYADRPTIGWLNDDGMWSIYEGEANAEADEVTAWMQLPRPYEEVTT